MVVSQELGAILGKPNGLAAEAGSSPSDARAAHDMADLPTVGRQQTHAFFPELGQLTKARPNPCCPPRAGGDLSEQLLYGRCGRICVSGLTMSSYKYIWPHRCLLSGSSGAGPEALLPDLQELSACEQLDFMCRLWLSMFQSLPLWLANC